MCHLPTLSERVVNALCKLYTAQTGPQSAGTKLSAAQSLSGKPSKRRSLQVIAFTQTGTTDTAKAFTQLQNGSDVRGIAMEGERQARQPASLTWANRRLGNALNNLIEQELRVRRGI